jgi:hypothetical protein
MLQQGIDSKPALTTLEMIVILATQALEHEKRTSELEVKVEAIAGSSGYFSVKAWARLQSLQMPNARAAQIGRECSRICRQSDLEIGKTRDEAFGLVNTYPEQIIAEVWNTKLQM